jgi:hypothetical protein
MQAFSQRSGSHDHCPADSRRRAPTWRLVESPSASWAPPRAVLRLRARLVRLCLGVGQDENAAEVPSRPSGEWTRRLGGSAAADPRP